MSCALPGEAGPAGVGLRKEVRPCQITIEHLFPHDRLKRGTYEIQFRAPCKNDFIISKRVKQTHAAELLRVRVPYLELRRLLTSNHLLTTPRYQPCYPASAPQRKIPPLPKRHLPNVPFATSHPKAIPTRPSRSSLNRQSSLPFTIDHQRPRSTS